MLRETTEGDSKSTGSREHLIDLMSEFETAMLVTDCGGDLRARPMAIAEVDAQGALWFVTSGSSHKIEEVLADRRVAVTLQSARRFVSVSGHADLVRDRPRIQTLWRESWRPWFPRGIEDPTIVLLRLTATEAEYWDMGAWSGFRYVFEAVRALVSGERMGDGLAPWHSKVRGEV